MKLKRVQTENTPVTLNGALKFDLQFFAEELGTDEPEGDDPEGDNPEDETKSFKQSELNKMMAREKRQGKASLIKQYGFKDETEFKAAMEDLKKFQETNKTEKEKETERALETEREKAALQDRVLKAEAKAAAAALGVNKDFMDDIITLALNKYNAEDGKEIDEIMEEMKDRYKTMFAGSKDEEQTIEEKGNKGTGKPLKNDKGGAKEEPKGLGARLAANRNGSSSKKSSFFSRG